ncbi:hypothetical protein C4U87_01055 [Clostridioides difficile]
MNRANRIIYDQTGKILLQTGEATGDVLEHDTITELHCIDIEYGSAKLDIVMSSSGVRIKLYPGVNQHSAIMSGVYSYNISCIIIGKE